MTTPSAAVSMSGKCYGTTLETSDFLRDNGFPTGAWARIGKGYRITWTGLSEEQISALRWHVETLLESSAGWDGDGLAGERAAMRAFLGL